MNGGAKAESALADPWSFMMRTEYQIKFEASAISHTVAKPPKMNLRANWDGHSDGIFRLNQLFVGLLRAPD